MRVTIYERLLLLGALVSVESDILTLRVLNDLRHDLSLTEAELKEHNVRLVDGRMVWEHPDYFADIPIGSKAKEIIKEALQDLNNKKKLTLEYLPIYERFVEDGGKEDGRA